MSGQEEDREPLAVVPPAEGSAVQCFCVSFGILFYFGRRAHDSEREAIEVKRNLPPAARDITVSREFTLIKSIELEHP